ncbi:protein mobC [Duganella callida]|uniref:Protein mobC n=1 Tax=Duganella callida TaxID=2561932 RepID=A0A4Y9S972_9BURK|nr:protein mobC [Duganella callida]TFW18289.1 protein mobC [Duganella callida]
MKYTSEQIDAIAAKLKGLPAVEKRNQHFSKQEAIALLTKEITALQKRGYTLQQIAEALRGEGLDIATPTLKSYLLRNRTARQKTPAPPSRPAAVATKDKGAARTASFPVSPDTDDI